MPDPFFARTELLLGPAALEKLAKAPGMNKSAAEAVQTYFTQKEACP